MKITSTRRPIRGLELCVHRFHEPDVPPTGTTLLLLHGYLDAGSTWDLVAAPLARAGFDVVAPDLRGYGASAPVGAGGYYHFPDYVADVAELVDRLAPERLAIVGHSMGGTIACLYAGAEPTRVWRLAVLEGLGPPAMNAEMALLRTRRWLRDLRAYDGAPKLAGSVEDATARLALHHPRVPREVLASRVPLLTKLDERGSRVWAYDALHRTTSPMPFYVEPFAAFLREIACPTLFVSGGAPGMHPPDEEERIAALRSVRVVELPDAGHMMHWSAPEALARELIGFFEADAGP